MKLLILRKPNVLLYVLKEQVQKITKDLEKTKIKHANFEKNVLVFKTHSPNTIAHLLLFVNKRMKASKKHSFII